MVLYELLAGEPPFKGEVEASIAYSIVHEAHQPLTSVRAGLPADLDFVLEKGLEKDPDDRYQNIEDLIVDLQEIHDSLGVDPISRPSTIPRPWGFARRSRKRMATFTSPQRLSLVAVLFAVITLAVVAVTQIPTGGLDDAPEVETVTVLPIVAAGNSAELQVFTDGLMETLTRRLSQYERANEQLVVVSPSEVRRQEVVTPADAYAKFGARYAIEGSLQSEGEAIRLVLTLVETESGAQVDTTVIDGRLRAALSLQDNAVSQVATLLNLSASDERVAELARLRPAAPGAYKFYLQGRGYLQRNDRLQDIDSAIEVFGRALEADSDYALAISGLCEAFWFRYQRTKESEWIPKAKENCDRALELNDAVAEIHTTMGTLLRGTGEYGKALLSFQTAVELDPRSGEAFAGLARTYEVLGAGDKAEATFQQSVRLRPADWNSYKQLGLFYWRQGDYQKTIEQYKEVVRLTPDNAQGYSNLGGAEYFSGNIEAARTNWEKSVAIEPRFSALANLGKLYSEDGDYEAAARQYEQAVELSPNDFRLRGNLAAVQGKLSDPESRSTFENARQLALDAFTVNPRRDDLPSYLAQYSLGLGDRAGAQEWIDRATRTQSGHRAEIVRNAETLERLGHRSRAVILLRRAYELGAQRHEIEKSPHFVDLLRGPKYQEIANGRE